MRRREFLTLVSGVATLWPLDLHAQQSALPVIGFLRNTSPDTGLIAAFHAGLNEAGFREGQNVAIDYRWTKGHSDQLSEMAAGLVRERVAVIVPGGDDAIIAAKSSTATIPIIFASGEDPIKAGYVTSLQPRGNLTGATFYSGAVLQPNVYAGQILKGKKPADLPIIQPTKFEFVINLTTAKARWD